jgi:hypothetical protein
MFAARWRWNLNRSLAVLRFRGGKKNPLPIQRMESDDLMAAVFPALAACQENAPGGPSRSPTTCSCARPSYDCLHEAMDVDGLVALLRRMEQVRSASTSWSHRAVGAVPRDPQRQALHLPRRRPPRRTPDARRADARGAFPSTPRRWAGSTPPPSSGVRAEAAPDVRGPEELHDRLFAERVESYRPEWLDDLCMSGEVVWGRLSVVEPAADGGDPAAGDRSKIGQRRSGKTPSRRTPITFMLREDVPWLLQAHRGGAVPAEPQTGCGREVLDALRTHGAQFHSDLQTLTRSLPTHVEEGLWDGVARGLIAADGFNAVRSLLHARTRLARRRRSHPRPGSRGRRGTWRQGVEGRWSLLGAAEPIADVDELAEAAAWQLLLRWGVVFRDVYVKERLSVPWREILWALRRLEARGLIQGGHFITGVTGEQFAAEEAAPRLRACRAG